MVISEINSIEEYVKRLEGKFLVSNYFLQDMAEKLGINPEEYDHPKKLLKEMHSVITKWNGSAELYVTILDVCPKNKYKMSDRGPSARSGYFPVKAKCS